MGKPGIKDPSVTTTTRVLRTLFSGSSAGLLGAAVSSQVGLKLLRAGKFPAVPRDRHLYGALGVGVVGFAAGYGCMSVVEWMRWKAIQMLLAYNGWMFNPKAKSTMLWGLMLKLLVGPGPHKMNAFQKVLPKLPVPDLEITCQRYLTVVKPLLTEEEFAQTELYIDELLNGDGPKLQNYLVEKRKSKTSWLADWWLTSAYLARRESIAIHVNFFMCSTFLPEISSNRIARTANTIHACLEYYEMIRDNRLPPDLIMGMIPVCMDGVAHMFSSCRIPGESIDHLEHYPDSKHIVVISYPRKELQHILQQPGSMLQDGHHLMRQLDIPLDAINPVAVLTSQDRTTWAKQRSHLMQDPTNAAALKAVESCIMVIVIGHQTPKNISEQAKLCLCGDGTTRWFDKCLVVETFIGGTTGGCNMEHTGADATHFAVMWEHCLQMEEYGTDGDLRVVKGQLIRDLPPPTRLDWKLEDIKTDINDALVEYRKTVDSMDVLVIHTEVGRSWMKSQKVSPDGFLQMAVQLAYWRMHQSWTKTYEPSSSRLFQLGRTDNINPVSEASIQWVHTMEDQSAPRDDKIKAMRAAIAHLSSERIQNTAGFGCDRHMLGLQMAAREMGMDVPRLFSDKSWQLPMKLSTSQVPTNIGSYGMALVPESLLGGFGPTDEDGYGLLYCSIGDDMYNMNITSWRTCPKTDSVKFGRTLESCIHDMRLLMEGKDLTAKSTANI